MLFFFSLEHIEVILPREGMHSCEITSCYRPFKTHKEIACPYSQTQSGPHFLDLPGDGAAILPSIPFQFLGKVTHVHVELHI